MAKQQWPILFCTFILSCISLALCIVSISTANWIISQPQFINDTTVPSDLNYGLFTGSYIRRIFDPNNPGMYNLIVTCLFNDNVCDFSCLTTTEARKQELQALYDGQMVPFNCERLQTNVVLPPPTIVTENNFEKNVTSTEERHFINAGLWLSTVIFLMIGILLTLACCIISILNTATNPIENFLSIHALYVWNASTIFIDLLVLILWGSLYGGYISKDVAIRDTITGQWYSDGYTSLGFSYWLLLPSMFLHAINIILLAVRQYLINKEAPTIQGPNAVVQDGTIFLY